MRQVQDVCRQLKIYLVNSLNPFRLEGQKTIMLRIIEQLGWDVPEWIVVPGGNWATAARSAKRLWNFSTWTDQPCAAAGGDQCGRRQYADGALY
jgi:hypothetical protein